MQATDQSLTQFRLIGGDVINIVEWKDMPRWSTADLLTGYDDERIELFTYNVSDDVSSSSNITVKRTATDLDTNVALNNAMASSEEMYIYSIYVEYIALATDPQDPTNARTARSRDIMNPIPLAQRLAELQRYTRFELEISQKIQFESPLANLNTGFGVVGSLAQQAAQGGANGNAVLGNAGEAGQHAVRRFAIPIHWGGQEKGVARLRNPTAEAVDFGLQSGIVNPPVPSQTNTLYRVRVGLLGLYKQPTA